MNNLFNEEREYMAHSIYKTKWFVIVIIIVFIGIVGCTNRNNTDNYTKENNSESKLPETTQNGINKEEANNEGMKESRKGNDSESVAKDPDAIDSKEMEETTIYKAGMYKVGSDMPSGEYVIQATDPSQSGYFEIAKDSSGEIDSIIANDIIMNNSYITVNEGELLTIDLAIAIPVEEIEPFEPINGKYPTGMYKVGYDISPGEYKVIMKQDKLSDSGYYEITSDSRHAVDSILSNDNFENNAYINVQEGQYLKLNDAYIEAKQNI